MEDNKSFWQQLADLGAGIYNNTVNQKAAIVQSQNNAQMFAGVVRFGMLLVGAYFGVMFVVSLFKRK